MTLLGGQGFIQPWQTNEYRLQRGQGGVPVWLYSFPRYWPVARGWSTVVQLSSVSTTPICQLGQVQLQVKFLTFWLNSETKNSLLYLQNRFEQMFSFSEVAGGYSACKVTTIVCNFQVYRPPALKGLNN